MKDPQYFKHNGALTDRSFMYKGKQVSIVKGVVTATDPVVIAALKASTDYKAVDKPAALKVQAEDVSVTAEARALLGGIAPRNVKAESSVAGTINKGIAGTDALASIKKGA